MDVADLPILGALAVAAAAGAASFVSPCVAPLLPGYVAFLAGSSAAEDALERPSHAALPRAIGFVTGFTILFALLGASAAALSRQITSHRDVLELVSGLVVALLGLAMAFDRSFVPARAGAWLQRSTSRHSAPASALAAVPIGAAFALAWTPCIGPALAAILTLAAGGSDPVRGAALLVAYSLGLGLPFLLGAVFLDRVHGVSRAIRKHAPAIRIAGGVTLTVIGVLIATGQFGDLTARLARLAPAWLV